MIDKLARSQAPVLHLWRVRQRKELAARLDSRTECAQRGIRSSQLWGHPESLMESEFFGYRKGPLRERTATATAFQAASGGTLFLDEVADLPLAMQVKLLRAIQEKRVRKVGASAGGGAHHLGHITSLRGSIRAASVQDLYYHLAVIPSLRMHRRCAAQRGYPDPG